MTKGKKRRRTDEYRLPPHIEEYRRSSAEFRAWRPPAKIPQRRVILAGIGLSLLCIGIALMLWLPSHSLVQDLRSDGVNAAATVIAVDNKPKYVKVRLVSGPEAGEEVNLSDYAGMYPDTRTGDAMIVTYDPADPSRILQRSWVEDPPVSLQTFIASASGLFLLVLDVIVIIRRYRMLRRPETPGPEGVSLTKP